MNKSTRLAKNTLFLYIRMFIILLITLYTSRLVLNALGFDDYGLYNVVGSIVVFLSFFEQALTNATSRYITYDLGTGDSDSLSKTYSMAIICHVILALLVFFILEIIGVWFLNNYIEIPVGRKQAANVVFQLSLLTFLLSIIKTPFNSNIIAHEEMGYYAFIGIIEAVLKLSFAFILISVKKDKLITYSLLQLLITFVVFLLCVSYCSLKFKDTKFGLSWNPSIIKCFVSYSGWSLLVNLSALSLSQSLTVFFNWFVGLVGNAGLAIANQVSASVNSFVINFSQAYNPQLIKSYSSGNTKYFNQLLFSSSKISFILLLFISLPLVANVDFVLSIWLNDYPPGTPTYIIIIILSYLIDSTQNALMAGIHATGRIRTHQIIVSTIKFVSIPVIYFLLKNGYSGALGVAILAIQTLLCAVARVLYMPNLIEFSVKEYVGKVLSKLLILLVLSVPIPIIVARLLGSNALSFCVSSLLSVSIILFISLNFVLDKAEKDIIKQIPIIKNVFNLTFTFKKCISHFCHNHMMR